MKSFARRFKELRESHGYTQDELAEKLGIQRPTIAGYESTEKNRIPREETLHKIADLFNTSIDYLMGRTNDPSPSKNPYYALTDKDERDIAKDLERMMNDLESNEAMAFHGEPMDDETRELIRISLENSMRLAKEMAKKKFTPKKYRK